MKLLNVVLVVAGIFSMNVARADDFSDVECIAAVAKEFTCQTYGHRLGLSTTTICSLPYRAKLSNGKYANRELKELSTSESTVMFFFYIEALRKMETTSDAKTGLRNMQNQLNLIPLCSGSSPKAIASEERDDARYERSSSAE